MKKDKKTEPRKEVIALIMGLVIGLIIGVLSTYVYMKHVEEAHEKEYEKEKLSITEKLSLEITKLGLKNSTYTFVDAIDKRINEINASTEEGTVKIVKGMYILKEDGIFYQVDEETTELVENGAKINNVDFGDKVVLKDSLVLLNEKAGISEAVFYVDEYKITYNLIGTTVTKLGEEMREGE